MNDIRSAGAVILTSGLGAPQTLLLDKVCDDGEGQTVAPEGRIEPGESPLMAAKRKVAEEAGISDPIYAGYLGQESHSYTDRDGTRDKENVDWFLFATDTTDVESLSDARWVHLDRVGDLATRRSFRRYLSRAADIAVWRQRIGFSRTLSDIIWRYANEASTVLAGESTAAIVAYGSAARGDFVDGWSDVDLAGWNIGPRSPEAEELHQLTKRLDQDYHVHCSLRVADARGCTYEEAGQLLDGMKLRGTIARSGIDAAVIAGSTQLPALDDHQNEDVVAAISACRDFTVQCVGTNPSSHNERVAAGRAGTLSALYNAARRTAAHLSPDEPLRLPVIASALEAELGASSTVKLLRDYDAQRRHGPLDLPAAEALAEAVPAALASLQKQIETWAPTAITPSVMAPADQ